MTFKGHSTSSAMCWWGPWLITDPLSLTAVTVWPLAGLQQPHRWERHRHTSVRLKPRFKYRQRWTLISVSGNEFQTVGAEQRKVHLVKSVLVNGSSSRPSGTADERSVRSLTRALMWRLRYVGVFSRHPWSMDHGCRGCFFLVKNFSPFKIYSSGGGLLVVPIASHLLIFIPWR